MVVCAIKFTQPELLERALSFKGSDYRMVDLIEIKYEQDENTLDFVLKEEAVSLGSRRSGFEVRKKIGNLLKFHANYRLVCDMSGVGVMSSSFADEVFGKLASEMGLEEYKQRISFVSVTRINEMLIGRAIEQRLDAGVEPVHTRSSIAQERKA